MDKLKIWLGSILLVQGLLVAGFLWVNQNTADFDQQTPLLSLDREQLAKVVIDDDKQSLTLEKVDGRWILPSLNGLPVSTDNLDEVLDKLFALNVGWPVATSTAGQQRFEVASDKFQRKIALHSAGGEHRDIMLGTSPSYRNVHARVDGSDDVFSVELAVHEFPTKANDWLDKSLIKAAKVSAVKGSDFEVQKNADAWQLAQTSVVDGETLTLDTQKTDELVKFFTDLSVQGVADKFTAETGLEFHVTDDQGTWTYTLYQEDGRHFIKRNDVEHVFDLSSYDYGKVSAVNRDFLLATSSSEEGTAEGEAAVTEQEGEPTNEDDSAGEASTEEEVLTEEATAEESSAEEGTEP